jgi:putative ABC transport system ATP-binding protein
MAALVTVSSGSKKYAGKQYLVNALQDVSLMLKRQEVVVLTGPSGSGKSTLLNVIGGIERLDQGELAYTFSDSFSCRGLDEALRLKYLGFVFQDFGLLPLLSALDNVAFPLQLKGYSRSERRRMAAELLEQVGLSSVAHKSVSFLSGGERQRVAIARAFINSPEIVLADEPTANLDEANVRVVLELLRNACDRRRTTVLMVSHDSRCASVADRHLQLKDGVLSDIRGNGQ